MLCISTSLGAFTPSADFILGEMAKRCVDDQQEFVGMLSESDVAFSVSAKLAQSSLIVDKAASLLQGQPDKAATDRSHVSLFIVEKIIDCSRLDRLAQIKSYFSTIGVDTKLVSHALFKDEPIYIIGTDKPDEKRAQVWIDKRNFMPVKEIAAQHVVIFDKWSRINDNNAAIFPLIIQTTINSRNTGISLAPIER